VKIKYGIFSDIHSNMEALTAVLQDMHGQGVTHPVCLGDIVGYNANPLECLRLVQALGCPVIKGNHDEIVSGAKDGKNFNALAGEGIAYSKRRLKDEDKTFLWDLPMQLKVGGFTAVHASMDDPAQWNYVTSDLEAESSFTYQMTSLCFCGHTHIPKVFIKDRGVSEMPKMQRLQLKKGARYLVNVGSVGQPRDRDWRSSYVIYTPDQSLIEFRRISYNIELTQRKILMARLPEPLAMRIQIGA
jgi:predicted phosphodiesterase